MPEFLQYGFMHRAFAAGVVTALICPAIGVFLIPRWLSLIADTLAHVALAGAALGLALGISPVLGALVVALAGAVGIERLRARGALQGDAALAVFLSGGFALAVVLISLARGFNADLFAILFGSILTVTSGDVWLMVALGAVVTVAIGGKLRQAAPRHHAARGPGPDQRRAGRRSQPLADHPDRADHGGRARCAWWACCSSPR